MAKNPMATSLSLLNRFAGSPLVHRLGIYKPAQQAVQTAVRSGFKAGAGAQRQWKEIQKLVNPERFAHAKPTKDLFDLTLTEEQQMVREMVQRFGREAMRPAAVKADHDCDAPEGFAAGAAELGLASLALPERFGGSATEAAVVTGVLAAEDLAAGDAGLALRILAPLGVANALVRYGSPAQQSKYLAAFADAAPPDSAIAIAEPSVLFDPAEMRTRATQDANGFVLCGEKSLVPLAESAELWLVAATLLGKGPSVFIVERGTPGVTVTAEPALGLRAASLGRLVFENVQLPHTALLGEKVDGCDVKELTCLARLGACAMAVGVGQAVLDYVIPYCNERIAFGEPVSNRQAVAFMIANIAVELESMRMLTLRAAARAEQGLPFHREAYLARVMCVEKGMEIGTNGVQLLGGHGFIKDHPVERWYRDLMALSVLEGGLSF